MIPIRDNIAVKHWPAVVLGLIAVNSVVFLYQISLPPRGAEAFIVEWAMIPRRLFDPSWAAEHGLSQWTYLTVLTNTFMHGGWLHIIFNMWVLYIFGCALEDRLGPARFLIFYLLCGIAASWAHASFNAQSAIPALGASGAVAGVIGAYARSYPAAVITLIIPLGFIPLFFQLPAVAFAGLWFILQILQGAGELLTPSMGGGIAWWAHIGGFVAGLVLLPLLDTGRPRHIPGPWG